MYVLIGLIIGTAISYIINRIRKKINRNKMADIPLSGCWITKDDEDGEQE